MMSDEAFHWPFGMNWWRPGARIDRIDGRLAYLKAELAIDEKQSGAWDAFAEAVRTSVSAHNEMVHGMWEDDEGATLPERLDRNIGLMEARLVQLKALREASRQLYAVLSDEQRKTADEILVPILEPGPYGMIRSILGR